MARANLAVTACSHMPDHKLHIKPGATDVIFILEEGLADLKALDSLEACLLFLVGQIELKTPQQYKVRPLVSLTHCFCVPLCAITQLATGAIVHCSYCAM
jgi:hypothetical protein